MTTLVSMCGIVRSDGRDCPNAVRRDAPINLCSQHFEEAFDWHRLNVYSADQQLELCPACGQREGRRGVRGFRCQHCGQRSPDFLGAQPFDGQEDSARLPVEEKRVSVVYYLAFRDMVKIGTSTNFRLRIESIPHDDVLAIEPGDMKLERHRHAQFADTRKQGEWFVNSDALAAHIATLKRPEGWARQLRQMEGKAW